MPKLGIGLGFSKFWHRIIGDKAAKKMLWKDDVNIILTPKHKYGAYHYDTAPYSQLSYLSYSPLQSKSTDTSTCSPKEAETPCFTLYLALHHSFLS